MAEIIDLDFYRKFRLILPVRPQTPTKTQTSGISHMHAKGYRRRQKGDLKPRITEK